MIQALLSAPVQAFIATHLNDDLKVLALKPNPFPDVPWPEILNQIAAKSKSREKLPSWFHATNILYPSRVSIEQTSSEKTAAYKAQLVSGESLIDLTGGFGVDDFYFAKHMKRVIHCEIDAELSNIAAHNFNQLGVSSIDCRAGDGTQILESEDRFDWIYVDPSRRHDLKGKVFLLADCEPNVPQLLGCYLQKANHLLVKTAPLLDITAGLSELRHVKEIHVVALENDVKELLWLVQRGYTGPIAIKTVNLKYEPEHFGFTLGEPAEATYAMPERYLYEPNSAILKSGGFAQVAQQLGLGKLHRHSHLYTSNDLVAFPGRRFTIDQKFDYTKPQMKAHLQGTQANVTVRNFPETVDQIRKKWKIADGGARYAFFTTDAANRKIVLLCTKIS